MTCAKISCEEHYEASTAKFMAKVGIVSLGCPKNRVDSEVMLGILQQQGHEVTPRAEEAEVIVVNTCSFIEPAQHESIRTILEMAQLKKAGSARRLVVAGCLAERHRQDILRELPEVDAVLGTNDVERIVEACALDNHAGARPPAAAPHLYHEGTPRLLSTPFYSAYLKIAEGCNQPCSFCIIPQLRGAFRSRPLESVRREAERLARQGVREVTLIGQDTTSYGDDLGLRHGLATLLRTLARIPDLVWIRFLYCYPSRVDDPLVEAVAANPKVCRYFDVPFQHASASVLKAMRRGSRGEHFLRLLEKIRAAIPSVALRTSLIVGFPGESERDFRELLDFIKAAEFDHLGVFTYSNEDSAASFSLPKQVPAPEAEQRRHQVMTIQRKISRRRLKAAVGQSLPLLVEGPAEETEHLLRGRLESEAPEIDGQVFINDCEGRIPKAGEFRWARVTAAGDYDLVARLEARAYGESRSVHGEAGHEAKLIQIRPIAQGGSV